MLTLWGIVMSDSFWPCYYGFTTGLMAPIMSAFHVYWHEWQPEKKPLKMKTEFRRAQHHRTWLGRVGTTRYTILYESGRVSLLGWTSSIQETSHTSRWCKRDSVDATEANRKYAGWGGMVTEPVWPILCHRAVYTDHQVIMAHHL